MPRVSAADTGRFVAIDVESGAYEIDRDDLAAIDRVRARKPDAQIWLRRIGLPYTHRFGARAPLTNSPATWTCGPDGTRTLADCFAGRTGRIDSGSGECLSENAKELFAQYLEAKRRAGTL